MAAFSASGNLTINNAWQTSSSPYRIKYKSITIVLSSQGGATNTIAATALGFQSKILGSTVAIKSDDAIGYPTSPSYDGSKLFFYNTENATDASRGDPADVTGTFRLTVYGY